MQKTYDIIKLKNLWLGISATFMIISVIVIALGWLKPGLDFMGGTLFELEFHKPVKVAEVRDILNGIDAAQYGDAKIQPTEGTLSVRTKPIDNMQQTVLFDTLKAKLGEFETLRVEVVGPTIGAELFKNSAIGFALVFVGIIGYISFRFRYDYAICAIAALAHDVLFLVGFFAILGKFWGTEIDSLFVTAALAVASFSINDTIVIYDRIRENIRRSKRGTPFAEIANDSVNQTLARSVNTSVTTLITLTFLFFFGGVTIRDFVLAMIIGIAIGTYSSIFVASPLMVMWRETVDKQGTGEAKAKTA